VSSHFIEERAAAVFARSGSVVNKFGGDGKFRAALLINSSAPYAPQSARGGRQGRN
jgi:hypothetical protein